MKVLLLSEACFNDTIFPLYKAMKGLGVDVTCLINLSSLNISLFEIEKRIPKQAIIKASEYKELKKYKDYVDMDKMFLVNHGVDRKHPWRDLTRSMDVIKFIIDGRFDIIHTDILFERSYKLLYLFRKKIVFIRHDPFPHTGHNYTESYKRNLLLAYNKIPKIVLLNETQREAFCKIFNVNSNKVYVNKLGVLECIKLHSTNQTERKFNILFFGRIVEYKGLEYLCKAMLKVHNAIPEATLTIAGSGSFYFDIEPYKQLPYIEIHNRFIKEKELAEFIQQSVISIFAYTDATQSGGILTSFALNKPVIASALDTLKEVVKDNHNGILVPPKDPDALADAIINLLSDEDLREKLKNNILNDNKYGSLSWDKIAQKYIEIYKA